MRVLITGGHFSPAYSIISELKSRGHQVAVAGRKHPFEGDPSISYEFQVCEKENLNFYEVKTGRFQRKFTSYTLLSLLKTPFGFIQALAIIKKAKPDVIMTFGGYIGLPISYAGAVLGISVVLHEQVQSPGLASRAIGKIASKICISFEESGKFFDKKRTILTGDPIRKEVFEINEKCKIAKDIGNNKKIIYITGGSTGSHFINSLVEKIVPDLLSEYVLIHQTGDSLKFNDYDRLNKLREMLPPDKKKKYILRKFIYPEEIGFVFSKSDLIISRSGVNTLFEIMAREKVSLLIPLPHGQTSEQLANAQLLSDLGISEYVEEKNADPKLIKSKISEIFMNEKRYKENMRKTQKYIFKDAAKKIVDILESRNAGQ